MRNKTEESKATESENSWEPLWAWCALAVASYNSWIIGGIFNCTGLIFVELLELYDAGYVSTSWLQTADFIVFTVSTLVVSAFFTRLSLRHFLFISSLTGVIGFLVAGFAQNLSVFILGFSIFSGIGRGFLYMPTAATVTSMFNSHKNFANGWYFACSSLGGVVWPFLFNFLSSHFSFKGAMIIIGGFWFQVTVVAVFMDPLMVKKMQHMAYGSIIITVKETKSRQNSVGSEPNKSYVTNDIYPLTTSSDKDDKHVQEDMSIKDRGCIEPVKLPTIITVKRIGVINDAYEDENYTGSVENVINDIQKANLNIEITDLSKSDGSNINNENKNEPDIVSTQSSHADISKTGEIVDDGINNVNSPTMETLPKTLKLRETKNLGLRQIYVDVVCSFIYWCHVLLHNIATNAYMTSLLLFPAYASDLGLSLAESTILLSIMGACELVSRMFYGYIGDKPWTNRRHIIFVCYFVCGAGMIALTFWGGRPTAYLHTVCLSLLGGVHMVYLYPLYSDIMDSLHFGPALGLANTLSGIVLSVFQIPLGSLREFSGSYIAPTQVLAGTYILSGIMSLFTHPHWQCSNKMSKQSKTTDEE